MNRKKPNSLGICGIVVIGLLGIASTSCATKAEKTARRPNVVILFADDQRADAMNCADNPYIRTPNIDNLAASGVHFVNNYFMGGNNPAVCKPSCAQLMSGKSLFHIADNLLLDGVTTMPQYFKSKGYEIFGTGKWHGWNKLILARQNVFDQ